jgi:hypothetical protein
MNCRHLRSKNYISRSGINIASSPEGLPVVVFKPFSHRIPEWSDRYPHKWNRFAVVVQILLCLQEQPSYNKKDLTGYIKVTTAPTLQPPHPKNIRRFQ